MSLCKLTAGSGYDYLTRQVAALDATDKGHVALPITTRPRANPRPLGWCWDERHRRPGRWTRYVSFAGTNYRVGNRWRGRRAQVCIVAGSVQLSCNGQIVRVHPIRHDQSKERN